MKDSVALVMANVDAMASRVTKTAAAEVRAVKEALKALAYRGASEDRLAKARQAMMHAVTADVLEVVEADRADRITRMKRIRDRWEADRRRSRQDRAEELARRERRYRAMSDAELREAAMQWLAHETETDPDILDALSGELRTRDEVIWQAMRERMVERDSYSPWTKEGLGKEIAEELKQLELCSPGVVPYTEDGKRTVIGISDLMDFEDTMEVDHETE